MTEKTRTELRLVLPDLPHERDACVARLESQLGSERGITRGHDRVLSAATSSVDFTVLSLGTI